MAAALLAALAGAGGALFSRRRPAGIPSRQLAADCPRPFLRDQNRIANAELRRLRRSAQQKTVLARSVAELLPSMPEALVWQAEKALAEVGVRAIVPDGEPFDAAAHHIVGTEPVPRAAGKNIVARTVRPGYADDEKILVYPKVVVYADDTTGGHHERCRGPDSGTPAASRAGVARRGPARPGRGRRRSHSRDDLVTVLDSIPEISADRPIRVIVAGSLKRGKSTLVNTLVGRPLLSPVGVDVTTACWLEIGYGEEEATALIANAQSPGQPTRRPIDITEVERYVALDCVAEPVLGVEVRVSSACSGT